MGTTHVIGAGLAGLAAAVSLVRAGRSVVLHEATGHAGGRCRSYEDRSLGMRIDNGNHIILSGNSSAIAYLEAIGASDRVSGPDSACFDFHDLASGERWQIDLGSGRLPFWLFRAKQRVPATRLRDYLALVPLTIRPGAGTVSEVIACSGPIYGRLLEPMLLATLNNDPRNSTARLAAAVLRETVAKGGRNCRPLVAIDGLASAFVDPALAFLDRKGAACRFGSSLRELRMEAGRVSALEFDTGPVALDAKDDAVLAVPPEVAARLVPGTPAPDRFRSIANVHFQSDDPLPLPLITGVVNATTQWIFSFPDRISVTISNSNALSGMGREELARTVWSEIVKVAGVTRDMPPWQVVRERRATFETAPDQEQRRPKTATRWRNLFLAGDWIDTGLPPTIEGAVRSGMRAAALSIAGDRHHA